MALTKRQMQKYRKDTSVSDESSKSDEYFNKYRKTSEQIEAEKSAEKAKRQADAAEREAYVNELTKQIEEQKKTEQDDKLAVGSYNNRMINPQSQVAKRDALSATLNAVPVNIAAKESPVKSTKEMAEEIEQDMRNREALNRFNETGVLPSATNIPETVVETKKEEVVLPGVTRKYTKSEQMQADIDNLAKKKQIALANRIGADWDAAKKYTDEANKIQKEIDDIKSRLENARAYENRGVVAPEDKDISRPVNVLNTAAYTAGRFGLGAQDTVENWASAVQSTIGDLTSYGNYSDEQNKLYTFLSEHPEMRRQMYVSGAGQNYAQQRVAEAAGVSLDAVKNYVRTSRAEDLREGLEDIEGVSDKWKNTAGNWAESIGQQVPGMMLGSAGAVDGASEVAKKIAENVTLGSIGGSVYGQTLEQLSRERGFDINNYINATLQGAIEVGTEKMGFTDLESLTNPAPVTGNTAKSVGRAIVSYLANGVEEGIEEFINAPMSEIADRLTGVSNGKNLVGSGGIFDIAEMVEGGLSGAMVGMIMGGVGSLVGIANAYNESKDIRQTVSNLRELQEKFPSAYRAEIPADLNAVTSETVDNIFTEQFRLWEQFEKDAENGNLKLDPVSETEQVPTDVESVTNQTNETVATENNTAPDTDNTADNTFDTTNDTELFESDTVEDTNADDTAYEESVSEFTRSSDEDSDIGKALRMVNVDPVNARKTVMAAYDNNAKAAVDALYEEGNRIAKEGGDFAKERLAQVDALRDAVLSNETQLAENNRVKLEKAFSQYGIKNVVVDSKLVTETGGTSTNAYYDPATKTIHVSPLLGNDAAMNAVAAHELVHHASTADTSLVSDIIAAKDSLVKSGVMDAAQFDMDNYVATYGDVAKTYGKSEEGKAAVQRYVDSGMSHDEAVYKVVDDYINEEIAGDFIRELVEDPDIAKQLTKDNRNFIQKIYDAIVDFINKLRGKEDVRKYQRLADNLRSILEDVTGEEAERKKATTPKANSERRDSTEEIKPKKRFSLSEPVEQVGDLVAVHNISDTNLEKALDMGGFAGISVAVAKASDGHDQFGDVSVVLGRDSIDPKNNKGNSLYSGDAWTARYPQLDYKASDEAKNAFKDMYKSVDKPSNVLVNLANDADNFMRGSDIRELRERLKGNSDMADGLMEDYLKYTQGESAIEPVYNVKYKNDSGESMTTEEIEMAKYFAEKLGNDYIKDVFSSLQGASDFGGIRKFVVDNLDDLSGRFNDYIDEAANTDPNVTRNEDGSVSDQTKARIISKGIRLANKYVTSGKWNTTKVEDWRATREKIRKVAEENGYNEWVDDVFSDKNFTSYIRNNKDPYTPSGNRRSFDSLHYEHTLENVVKAMKEEGEQSLASNAGNIFGASAKKYKTVEDMKTDSGRLQTVDEDGYNELRDSLHKKFVDLIRPYDDPRSASQLFIDAVVQGKTKKGIDTYLRKNSVVHDYDPSISDKLYSLVKDIQSMPTDYFEAKLMRVVGLDEVKAFIVPDDISASTKAKLESTKKPVLEYTRSDKQSRLDALNSLEGVRFSKDTSTTADKKQQERMEFTKRQLVTYNADGSYAKAVNPEAKSKFVTEVLKNLTGVPRKVANEQISKAWKVPESREFKTPEARYDAFAKACHEAATEIISSAHVKNINPLYDQYKDLMVYLRDQKIYVNDSMKNEFEDYGKLRKDYFGTLNLTNSKSDMGIDSVWQELNEMFPELFPAEVLSQEEMLTRLFEVAESLKPIPGNPLTDISAQDPSISSDAEETIITNMTDTLAQAIMDGYTKNAVETKMAQAQRKYVQLENASAKAYAESMRDAANVQETLENERIKYENAAKQNRAEYEGATMRFMDDAQGALNQAHNAVVKAENFEKQTWAEFEREKKELEADYRRKNKAVKRVQEQSQKRVERMREQVQRERERTQRVKDNAKWRSEELRRTQERAAIRKDIVSRVGRLYTALTKPTNSKHIPPELQKAVAGLLEELSGVRLANGKVVDKTILNSIKVGETDATEGTQRNIDSVVGIISRNKTTDDGGVTKAFVEQLREQVKYLNLMYSEINSKSADDISTKPKIMDTKNMAYLEQVQRIVSMVEKYVQNANTNFLAGKVVDAHELGEQIQKAVSVRDPSKANSTIAKLEYDYITPDTFFSRLGEPGKKIIEAYRNAQSKQVEIEDSYVKYLADVLGGDYKTNDVGWGGKLIDISKKQDGSVMVTKDQIMEFYCLSKRPVGRRHLMKGGAYFTTQEGLELNERHFTFTKDDINKLCDLLSDKDKAICDGIMKYFSSTLAAYGNEASMYMYGFEKFSDKLYFPIHVAKESLPTNWDNLGEFSRLENRGFTKAVGDSNSSPVALHGFFNTADNHAKQMAYYASYAPVNNDVTRMMDVPGVGSSIKKHLGTRGYAYLEDFVHQIDLRSSSNWDNLESTKPLERLSNAYKRAAVSYNVSTALKQPLSIIRAADSINDKYIVGAYKDLIDHKKAVATEQRMMDGSAIARIKVMGFSDVGFGQSIRQRYDPSYSRAAENHKNKAVQAISKGYEKFTDFGMVPAGKMDEVTWIRIWRACELEVADKYGDLTNAQKEKKVAARFAEVIGETQVVDSVLDYSPIMRSKTARLYTAFMAEPVKQINSFISAADAVKSAQTDSEKKSANKRMGKTVRDAVISMVVAEPLVSILMSMFRDDEDDSDPEKAIGKALNMWIGLPTNKDPETYMSGEEAKSAVEELIEAGYSKADAEAKVRRNYVWGDMFADFVASEIFTNVTGSIPVAKTLIEVVTNALNGYSSDSIDVAGVSKAVKSIYNVYQRYEDGTEKQKSDLNLWLTAIEDTLAIAGIPARTIRRDLTAVYRAGIQATDSYVEQWELNKMLYNVSNTSARSQKNFYDIMAKAAQAGDIEAYKYMSDDLESIITSSSVGVKRSTIMSALQQRGYEPEIGSDIWYIDLQAGFDLESFNTSMNVEKMITSVYSKTKDDSILPSSISNSFTVNKETVKVSDPIKYQSFATDAGDFAYMILTNMDSNSDYKGLDDNQKAYAIKQAYTYARARARKRYNSGYKITSNAYAELYESNATPSEVAREIIWKAEEKDYSEDEDED